MRIKGEIITRLIKFLNLFLFPPKCFICDDVLEINHEIPMVCEECKKKIKVIEQRYCSKCSKPLDLLPNSPFCPYCHGEKLKFEYLTAPFVYKDFAKDAILKLKFKKRPFVGYTLGYYMFERLKENKTLEKIDALVPAPLSKKRFFQRGYSQTLILAEEISRLSGIKILDVLEKNKDTTPQSLLSSKERKENIRNSISAKFNLNNENILFVDDVYTTGSTSNECCKILKNAGAGKIYTCVFATSNGIEYEKEN